MIAVPKVAPPDFVLTEEVLHSTYMFIGGGYAIEKTPFVPIAQVAIDWVVEAARSVCALYFLPQANPARGSAFYMDRSLFTARHCVPEQQMDITGVYMQGEIRMLTGSKYRVSDADALRIYADLELPGLDLQLASPKDLSRFLMIGYPGNLSVEVGPYVSWNGHIRIGATRTLANIRNRGGFSGSPAITYERELVGIINDMHGLVSFEEAGLL